MDQSSDNLAGPGASPVIRVADVATVLDGRTVLDGVRFDVPVGRILVVMGPSGCGKTTLLRHMVGALAPTRGHVELLGQDLSALDEAALDKLRRRFGVLFQSGALFNSMTVSENVALPLREHTRLDESTIDVIVRMKLELVDLRAAGGLMPSELSGGMKKRAGLARAIALDPEVLFVDEPSAGLDPVAGAEIDRLIIDLTNKLGVTCVVVTHEMDSAFRIADRMVMLYQGRVLREGSRREFESLRDGAGAAGAAAAAGDEVVRQFLTGGSGGPLSDLRRSGGYAEDVLSAAQAFGPWKARS